MCVSEKLKDARNKVIDACKDEGKTGRALRTCVSEKLKSAEELDLTLEDSQPTTMSQLAYGYVKKAVDKAQKHNRKTWQNRKFDVEKHKEIAAKRKEEIDAMRKKANEARNKATDACKDEGKTGRALTMCVSEKLKDARNKVIDACKDEGKTGRALRTCVSEKLKS